MPPGLTRDNPEVTGKNPGPDPALAGQSFGVSVFQSRNGYATGRSGVYL
ncbi:MAG: hypothetical protein JWO38_7356 [Gemmataceae bacterium]|nr:hypothetical protein [Gemmataceae bacterium]